MAEKAKIIVDPTLSQIVLANLANDRRYTSPNIEAERRRRANAERLASRSNAAAEVFGAACTISARWEAATKPASAPKKDKRANKARKLAECADRTKRIFPEKNF